MAQPPRRSYRIKGLPPELPGVSSEEEINSGLSVHSKQFHRPRTNRNLFPEFSRSVSEGNQPLSSPSHSNLETPLVSKNHLEVPSILGPEVLATSGQGSETFIPSDHDSRVSIPSIKFPDLITFLEPNYETCLFPNEGPILTLPSHIGFEALLFSGPNPRISVPWNLNSEALFEVNSETSLPLYEGQGSNTTPTETESLESGSTPIIPSYPSYLLF